MEGKLIKLGEDNYDLLIDFDPNLLKGYDLSLTNCQAIERGYDLDELAKIHHKLAYIQAYNPDIAPYVEADYKTGFQKALEILGDRKFTEDDVRKIIHWSTLDEDVRLSEEDFFQSLQQTEWDVEVEMICPHPSDTYRCGIQYGCDEDGCNHPNQIPYLDADGCLILKLKSE